MQIAAPVSIRYARSEAVKTLVKVGEDDAGAAARPNVLIPGTPKEILPMARKAFDQVLTNLELLADGKKAKYDVEPINGREVERSSTACSSWSRQ